MRKILFAGIALFLGSQYFGYTQDRQVFYYHNEHKIFLDKVENTRVIHFNKTIETIQKDSIGNILKASNFTVAEITPFAFRILNNFDDVRNTDIISTAIESGDIIYTSDMLLCRDSTLQWASNKLFINIHPISDIFNILKDNKIPVVDVKQFGSDLKNSIFTPIFNFISQIYKT